MIKFRGKEIPASLQELIDPSSTALLVWDMQYDIAGRAFNKDGLISSLKVLIAEARTVGVPVIYSQHTYMDLGTESISWVRMRMKASGVDDANKLQPFCVEESEGWKVMEEVQPVKGDYTFSKRRPNAFLWTDFEYLLKGLGVKTVLVTGVSTEGGVEGTVRHGSYIGYNMVVVRDCVGSHSREGHELALKYMERTFDVYDSKDIMASWRSAGN